MKKLSYLTTAALAAIGFSTSANADVSVSGSTQASFVSGGGTTEWEMGGGVAFALSTTTANGMGVAASMGATMATDGSAAAVTGNTALTLTTGGATIVLGVQGVTGQGVGDIGTLASDQTMTGAAGGGAAAKMGITTGTGVSLSTAVGGATLSVGYLFSNIAVSSGADLSDTENAFGASVSVAVTPAITATVGYATGQETTTDSDMGIALAMTMGSGTATVGYNTVKDGSQTETSMGAVYALSLDADTSLSIGTNQSKDANGTSTTTDLAISKSLGGGVSAYIEASNLTGYAGDATGTNFGIGTSVAF